MEQTSASGNCVEIAHLNDVPDVRNRLVHGNREIACGNEFGIAPKTDRDAAALVELEDNDRGGFNELELELIASGIRTTRGECSLTSFEDDPFGVFAPELIAHEPFGGLAPGSRNPTDRRAQERGQQLS